MDSDKINLFKQSYHHSCLATVLLMISGFKDQKLEEKIYLEGENRKYGYYLNDMLASFVKYSGKSINVLVDNKFFTKKLAQDLKEPPKQIRIVHRKINSETVSDIVRKQPAVVYIDYNFMGDYSHSSHFVVVNSIRKDDHFEIFNSIDGKNKFFTAKKLDNAIFSLKNHIKMCPIIITMR